MSEFGRRFDPSELADAEGGGPGDAGTTEMLAVARDLETFARSESVTPSADFEDRVMAVIAAEPTPRSVGTGGLLGLASAVRDAWRLTWTTDRPLLVRGQAFAVVLLAVVALGSVGSLAAVGVTRLLSQTPPPVVEPSPLPTPSPSVMTTMEPSPSPSPSISPSPSPTPTASPTAKADTPTSTARPNKSAQPAANSGPRPGAGSGSGSDSSGPNPKETEEPSDESSGSGSGLGEAEDFETPRPTDYDSSGTGSGEETPDSEPGR
ncbi:MAG: hypothetical protein ABJC39_11215 [Chloroflexota bacterium]